MFAIPYSFESARWALLFLGDDSLAGSFLDPLKSAKKNGSLFSSRVLLQHGLHYYASFIIALIFLIVFIGLGTAVFLFGLDYVTNLRFRHSWLPILAPVVGLLFGWLFTGPTRNAAHGSISIVTILRRASLGKSVSDPSLKVPGILAPVIIIATWLSHLVGLSVGREGTAIQMGGGLASSVAKFFNFSSREKILLLKAGVAGGFSAVFGVPIAGAIFAAEVTYKNGGNQEVALAKKGESHQTRLVRWTEFIVCLVVSYVCDLVARFFGVIHVGYPGITAENFFSLRSFVALLLTSASCGLLAWAFLLTLRKLKFFWVKLISSEWLRPAVGGLTFAIIMFYSRGFLDQYAGLGVAQIQGAFTQSANLYDPFIKLGMTAFALSVGFKGGEVTPLFFIGATCGSSIAGLFGLPPFAFAAIGLVACFGAAAEVPIAAAAIALELFGPIALMIALPVCIFSSWICRHSRLYDNSLEL